jgi:hypothetical protein
MTFADLPVGAAVLADAHALTDYSEPHLMYEPVRRLRDSLRWPAPGLDVGDSRAKLTARLPLCGGLVAVRWHAITHSGCVGCVSGISDTATLPLSPGKPNQRHSAAHGTLRLFPSQTISQPLIPWTRA